MQLNAYLNFNGQCEAAFKFYEKCLGGKIEAMARFENMPGGGGVSPEWRSKIMHAQLNAGGAVLMGSDAPDGRYQTPQELSFHCNPTIPPKRIAFLMRSPKMAPSPFQSRKRPGRFASACSSTAMVFPGW